MAKHRLQFDLDDHAFQQFSEIRSRAGLGSNAELFRQALAVYDWFLKQRERAAKIQVVDGDRVLQIEFDE